MSERAVQDSPVRDETPAAIDADAPPVRLGSAWNDVPLRNKTVLLVVLASVGGALIGLLEATGARSGWLLSVGLTSLVALLLVLSKHWIGAPLDDLVVRLKRISREYDLQEINSLPIDRRDEVGQIARSIHRLTSWSRRDYHEARHLRRTLDHRVAEATKRATIELRQMVMRDALTDLGNRRFLEEHLEPLVMSVRESKEELACVLIDVDNFKTVNDTLGHAVGDKLLTELSALIKASARHEDYAIRLGGDEFVVLMPGCNAERAGEFARRLVAMFRQRKPLAPGSVPEGKEPSLSIGVACLHRDDAHSGHELMSKADALLYDAKRAGKNQVAGV